MKEIINLDGMSLIITNTNKKHKLTDSEYNKRRDECNEALKALQLRHNIKNLCDFSIEEFEMYKNEITLPLHTLLTNDDVEYIIKTYKKLLRNWDLHRKI